MEYTESPIGSTPMNTQVLKEPRGLMRCLQLFFAILAFSVLANYSGEMKYSITCGSKEGERNTSIIVHKFSYPFRLDHEKPQHFDCTQKCGNQLTAPGDFSSDAEFFVFTGVVSFLSCIGILIVYVFFSPLYSDESKKPPMIDFWFTVIIAIFWISASSAWCNGLINLKYICSGEWIFKSNFHPCLKSDIDYYVCVDIKECKVIDDGHFAGANIAALLGFLNFFLWASSLWFIYKETTYFSSKAGTQQMEG